MKILYFTSSTNDYLSDSLFHGFRSLYGANCIDFPKSEPMYKNFLDHAGFINYGKGFTLYSGLLDDIPIDRYFISEKVESGFFDLIIFSDIQRQYGYFVQYLPWLKPYNTIIIDGADTTQPYPARGFWWRRPHYWFLPKAHKKFLYFKREWTPDTSFSLLRFLSPKFIHHNLPQSEKLRPISFSIPEEKIISSIPLKNKDFPVHIVDPQVAASIPGATTSYAFESEQEYYMDLQQSRFGITTKRAGWDCMRHYEIAANGAVPCFRDLSLKPTTCAPHGLTPDNTIFYRTAKELLEQVTNMGDGEYTRLQTGALNWVREKSTIRQAQNISSIVQGLINNIL